MKSNEHIPVLLKEAIDGLNIDPSGIYVDMTLGRGGHSSEILKRLNDKGLLICFDQDQEAIDYSSRFLEKFGKHFLVIKDNFRNLKFHLNKFNISKVNGVLFDLGVSSPQFDEDYRGFSYNKDSELDMRMNQENKLTAKDIVNNYSESELVRVFKEYGEERYSYSIARNIVKYRSEKPINSTFELVDIIKKSKPKKELSTIGHPAKQVFQALRIEVNDELEALKEALTQALDSILIGGRVVVITFQSLEDKIVKRMFRERSFIEGDRINDYIDPSLIKTPDYKEINRKVIIPSEEEMRANKRSKSAKLRIIEKVK